MVSKFYTHGSVAQGAYVVVHHDVMCAVVADLSKCLDMRPVLQERVLKLEIDWWLVNDFLPDRFENESLGRDDGVHLLLENVIEVLKVSQISS